LKVYINKYRDNWLSPYTILDKVFFWREIDYEEPVIARWSDRLQPLCLALQRVLGVVNPKIDYVKIDRWDTWSMDHTLSTIALPMLIQLKSTAHGAPLVDDEDVPEGIGLRSTEAEPKEDEYDVDSNHFKRWDWVLEEMIHAHRSKVDDSWEDQFWTGEWGDTLWEKSDVEFPNPITGKMESTYSMSQTGNRECDWEGLKKEQERIQNGFRLFGKYYQNLWD
jgi:hypothetical protein